MISATTTVDGAPARYATGGRGLPVLFLHGWGLDHEAYQSSLKRLTARNCRVYSPSLPGFGGTEGLPLYDHSLPAFARWVDGFLDAVGVDEPVVVMGHSFGGGIATMFAHNFTDRVRHLVIVNSVGDPDGFLSSTRRQGIGDLCRSLADPLIDTISPSARGSRARQARRSFLKNLTRDPFRFASTALIAVTAQLQREMENLAAGDLPVSVLWSDRDGVIPMSAFDTFCSTFGAEGRVVRGGHSWLLASPDTFGDVLDNMIHIEAAEHRDETTTATTAKLRELLAGTSFSGPAVSLLMKNLSPLWLLSAPPSVLAVDLTLCHPRLREGEVRAVAQPVGPGDKHRLTVVAHDRPGLLADSLAVLISEGLKVESASAMTWPHQSLALHTITVRAESEIADCRWDTIGTRIQAAAEGDVVGAGMEFPDFAPEDDTEVVILGGSSDGASSYVRVTSPDRSGLLLGICRWFANNGLSIEAADVSTFEGFARDVFLVTGECDVDALARHLGRTNPSALGRLARSIGIDRPSSIPETAAVSA